MGAGEGEESFPDEFDMFDFDLMDQLVVQHCSRASAPPPSTPAPSTPCTAPPPWTATRPPSSLGQRPCQPGSLHTHQQQQSPQGPLPHRQFPLDKAQQNQGHQGEFQTPQPPQQQLHHLQGERVSSEDISNRLLEVMRQLLDDNLLPPQRQKLLAERGRLEHARAEAAAKGFALLPRPSPQHPASMPPSGALRRTQSAALGGFGGSHEVTGGFGSPPWAASSPGGTLRGGKGHRGERGGGGGCGCDGTWAQ